MPKPRYKTTNWKQYNQVLINCDSLMFWIDKEAIREWKQGKQNRRGGGILGMRSSEKLSGWLPKVIWLEQALERALWLPQKVNI
ncbi:hypothetical protein VSA01S_10690 [Vibrio sagamiensis NBRC 104589]|uniref:Transposase DDE domain-containing protein n=1 Tax=Vibrio sagamiensis NBRC 104589 TaxID=1219064 RepID=A0A511QCN5_9VIBR|nr:hypothetical protein VSA01S_10690 [Vibrio sagamiensis NBRC 104589]